MGGSTILSTLQTSTSIPCNSAGAKPPSQNPKQVQNPDKQLPSSYRKSGAKLDPKMLAHGKGGLKQKSGQPLNAAFACQIFKPLTGGKIKNSTADSHLKGRSNHQGSVVTTFKVHASNGRGKTKHLMKPFSKNLIYATSKERTQTQAQAVKDAIILLTKKDKSGRSLKTRLYDMLVRHWTHTGQSTMEYPQYEKYLKRAMQTKVNWASNHFWNTLRSGCRTVRCRNVDTAFRRMRPTTLGNGGVIEHSTRLPIRRNPCPKTVPCVRSSSITLTTQTPIISVRDNGVKHPRGLAHTVAHEYLHVFFHISGALNHGNEHHRFTQRLGLGGSDDARTAHASPARP